MKRILTALLLTAALCYVSLGWACNKQQPPCANPPCAQPPAVTKEQAIAYAKDIADGLRSAQPIIARLNPAAGKALALGLPIADDVIAAVEKGDVTKIASLLNTLIPIVDRTVAQFTNNVTALGFLALADIGIHFLINHAAEIFPGQLGPSRAAKKGAPPPPPIDVPGNIQNYAAKPVWGCQYHPEKC